MSVFIGSAVSLITPLHKRAVDFTAFTRLIELQIASGSDAVVVCDAAGETASLTSDERLSVIQYVVERVNGRIPVIAGADAYTTDAVIENVKTAEAIGADAVLIAPPCYLQPTQAGLVDHFTAIADSVELPILLYNAPVRTGVNLLPATISDLSKHENIVGVKESSGNIEQIVTLAALCPSLDIYAGNDDHVLPVLSIGGKGAISTVANVVPDAMHALCDAYFKGDTELAREIQIQMIPLWKAAFCETNPGPIKAMMSMLKLCDPDVRPPLAPPSPANLRVIEETLRAYQLI